MPKIGVLLATYNGAHWLKEQLHSIIHQQDVELALYVSDDGSTDETLDIIQQTIQVHQHISLLPGKLRFGSAAQNFFRLIRDVNLEQFAYIAFSDQDDVWLPKKLKCAVDLMHSRSIDGYSSNVTAFWHDGKTQLIHKAQPQKKYDYMFESAGPGCTFVISQKLARSLQELLRRRQTELNTIALHDWFIYAFARSRGYQWYIDQSATLLYRQHTENVVGANTGIKAFMARLSKLKQGWYLQQILLIAKELGYQQTALIKKITRLSIWDRCYLAVLAYQCRRRLRDRFAFAFFVLFLARKP